MSDLEKAIGFWRAGKFREARVICAALLADDPHNVAALNLLAEVHRATGNGSEAIECLARVSALCPRDAAATRRLADAYLGAGDLSSAIQRYRAALTLEPHNARAHNNLGLAQARCGDPVGAEASYRHALTLDPRYTVAHNNLGNLLAASRDSLQALACYERAVAATPGFLEAWSSGARELMKLERFGEAIAWCERVLALKPDDSATLVMLASALRRVTRLEEALRHCRQATALRPDNVEALYLLANLLQETCDPQGSAEAYRKILRLNPRHLSARMGLVMTQIPTLAQSAADIERSRHGFADELRALESWLETAGDLDEPVLVGAEQPFHLAYQIENNRELLSAYGRMCSRLMTRWRSKQVASGGNATRRDRSARRRLGIVSGHVHNHSVYHAITKGWIGQLDRSRFEITIFNLAAVVDDETERARRAADHFESGPLSLGEWLRRIESSDVDVLLYPEIGMYPVALQLGGMRLAPVQVASWGHPETTGLPTIDYFLSAESFETPESPLAYAETLLCLPNLGTYCEAPGVAATPASLGRFSFKDRGPVLLCGGIPFKYGPQHDSVLVELAKRLRRCQFWFFEYSGASLSRRLLQRLEDRFRDAGLDPGEYLVMHPWATPAEFAGLLRRADVFLDTIGFSGFNTILLAVECGVPIVTFRGQFMRGRFGAAILERLGLAQHVAASDAEYVEFAARLAGDPVLNRQVRTAMSLRKGGLYRDTASIEALQEFLGQAAGSV